jgi:hypothetical protein
MAHLVSIRSTGSAGSSLTIHRVSGKPYEGKPHVRFDEGSIGYQGDDLLERDTHLKREKQFALTESAHHCTIVLLYECRGKLFLIYLGAEGEALTSKSQTWQNSEAT